MPQKNINDKESETEQKDAENDIDAAEKAISSDRTGAFKRTYGTLADIPEEKPVESEAPTSDTEGEGLV